MRIAKLSLGSSPGGGQADAMNLPDAWIAFGTGLAVSASLIVAIGAQNAFVLRQGLERAHVGLVVVFCALADLLLMTAGVLGMGTLLASSGWLDRAVTAAGAAFLAGYGLLALRRAARPGVLTAASDAPRRSRGQVLAQAAAFTLLNPHVYLDTVLLVGTLGAQQPPALRGWFLAGGALASAAWFTALGYGARALAGWFARPAAWRVLDLVVGLTMLTLAAGLAMRMAA
jgi:L-lysine exporter family protein LysE/ArgO